MRVPLTGMLTFDDMEADDIDSNSLEDWDVDELFEDDYDGIDCIMDSEGPIQTEEDELAFLEEVYRGEDFDGLHEEGVAIALAMAEDIGLERQNNFVGEGRTKVRGSSIRDNDGFPRVSNSNLRPFERYVLQQLYGDQK